MKPLQQPIARLGGMLLLAVCIMAGKTVDAEKSLTPVINLAELNGGGITSSDQTVYFKYLPEPITASTATGGDCGSHNPLSKQFINNLTNLPQCPSIHVGERHGVLVNVEGKTISTGGEISVQINRFGKLF